MRVPLHHTHLLGARFAFAAEGTGPTLLLVHGAGRSGATFRKLVPGLVASGHRVVVPDLPGCGASDKPPSGCSLDELRARLAAFVAQVVGPVAGVVGEGSGAVLVAGVVPHERSIWLGAPRPRLPPALAALVLRGWVRAGLAGLPGSVDPGIRQAWALALGSRGGGATAAAWVSTRAALPGFGWWVCGARDPFALGLPPGRLVRVPGAGLLVHEDAPREVAGIVERFVDSHR